MKKIFFSLIVCLFVVASAIAQRTVSGKITDEDGESLPGVNVVIKGTTTGVTTDLDGNYRISVDEGATLVFSFVGFETQEVQVGTRTVVDIALGSDATELAEVVVTGIAIEKEKRSIGYGIGQVSGDDLTVARDANIVNALQGKTTGVIVNNSSGNLGGSSQVIIRGITSLAGNNNPLWVVDGVPINNSQVTSGQPNATGASDRITGNRDFFNGAAVINPDDVESMSILKGAAATALYGSRAAAGAIIVTTKSGKSSAGGGPTISFSSSYRIDKLFRAPDMQYEYAGGIGSKYDSSVIFNAFGPRIQGQTVNKAVTHESVPLSAFEENYNDFYETGKTLINNISIEDGSERGNYRFSVTSLNQDGILPGAELDRLTTSLSAGINHTDWLKTRFNVQYIRTESQGTGAGGANDQNVITWTQFTPTTDWNDFRPWVDASGNQINIPNTTNNNPMWIRKQNHNDRDDDRFIASLTQIITPIENLNITSRLGYDYEYDERFLSNAVGTITRLTGTYDVDVIQRRQFNWDGIVDYNREFGEIKVTGLVGFNYNSNVFDRERLQARDLAVPGLFNPAAAQTTIPLRDFTESRLMGLYGQFDIAYKNWLTLTITGRNDWSSTLPVENNSYFYPSVSTAFVFTDAFGIANDILSFGKLRASWAQVGNTANPYSLDFRFFAEAVADGQYNLDLTFPFGGQLGFNKTGIIPNQTLLPEEQTSIELGTELQFFDGRLSLDVNYFNSVNENQIINQPIPESTGFANRTVNAAKVTTSGFEITLSGDILNTGGLVWNSRINVSTNKVEVSGLGSEFNVLPGSSAFNSVQVAAVDGGSIELRGIPWERDSATNRPLINPNTGKRIAGDAKSFGSVFPDATWGWINSISYKGITLSVTVDGRVGGLIKSGTVENLWDGGFTTETAINRLGTVIDTEGVIDNGDGTVRDNDVPVRSTENFWETLSDNSITEHSIFGADFIKLREVGITYTLPSSIVSNTPFDAIQVGIEGRNLALLYSKVPHIDPEANLFGSGSAGFGVERNATPSTRSFGANLRLRF